MARSSRAAPSLTAEAMPPGTGLAILGVNLMVLMATLDMSIVNVSLPTLAANLGADFPTAQWVIISYVLVISGLLLSVSRLGDIRGKKSIFSKGLVVFTLASLACGLAPDVFSLIAFRAVQGVGAAMTQALGIAIVTQIVPPSRRGRAIGVIGATVSLGLALGPSVGGILIGYFDWRVIFLINVPLGALAWVITRRHMPDLPPIKAGQKFDILGAAIFFLALAAYSLAMTWGQSDGFDAPPVMALLATAALGFAAFLAVERSLREPMIDLALFCNPLLTLNLLMGLLGFIALSANFILPFYLQLVQGYTPQQIGFMMMVIPVCMGLVAPFAGRLSDRYGSRGISLLGLVIMVGGCLALGTMHEGLDWFGFVLRAAPLGLGVGCFQAPNNSAIMGEAPRERLGVVSGLLNYSRTLGQTTGLPLSGMLFSAFVASMAGPLSGVAFEAAPHEVVAAAVNGTYRVLALVLVANVGLAVAAFVIDKRRRAAVTES